ncbi:GntR family transcriptional regulator [Arenibaculum sp.]|jgi:GntR family transcriptional regulator|uniref:GntR family transcriptional regulator n=1 Tax=Arenibaculum sp. TaxID=2865862 RepID=UPI002E134A51|nr:GntR family transcriptional regulator [Arenibaculum sp.]
MGEAPVQARAAYAQILAAVDPTDPTPRYLQLATVVRDLVQRGVFRPGEALPSERDLSAMTGFARVTVRRAIDELLKEGILSRRHGSGTYVARRIEQPLSILAGFSEDMKTRGLRPGSTWIGRVLARPTPQEALALGVGPNDQVVRLSRVRTADDEPLALEVAVIPAAMLPSPDLVQGSLYAALSERGYRPAHGVQRLHAALATAEEARQLLIPVGGAILRIERRAFLANGRPLEFTTSAYRGDRYDFVATLKGIAEQDEKTR